MTKDFTVLERRLDRLSGSTRIESDEDFAAALDELIDAESEKSAEQIDSAMLEEALDALLCFAGEDPEAIEGRAADKRKAFLSQRAALREKRVPQTGERPKRRVSWRIIAPVAAAILILASLAAVTFAGGRRLADFTNAFWKTIAPGEHVADGGVEIRKALSSTEYGDFDEMTANESDLSGVLLPRSFAADSVLVTRYNDGAEIEAALHSGGADFVYQIELPATQTEATGETEKIGGFDVLVSSYDGKWQGEWISDGAWYLVRTDSEIALRSFIAALAAE